MTVIDKVHKVVGGAHAAGRCKITSHLIAPRAVKGVLGDRQQFDMRIAHGFDIVNDLMRKVTIVEKAVVFGNPPPTGSVNFVDVDRLVDCLPFDSAIQPFAVMPFKLVQIPNPRLCVGAQGGKEGIGIGFIDPIASKA